MERKVFLQFLAATVATGSMSTFLESCKKSETSDPTANFTLDLSASANSALLSSGGSVVSNKVIVINNNGTYIALSNICTHEGCAVNHNKNSNQLVCPCHSAVFGIDGSVKSGPAPKSLKQFTVTKDGNILTVKG
jgi:cytochrome b6-f complex iron-sulfur subunit